MHLSKKEKLLFLGFGTGLCMIAGPLQGVYGSVTEQTAVTTARVQSEEFRTQQSLHWRIGDTVVRNIDGKAYRFRCIDQNYYDAMDDHKNGALFLCDSVIPANTGSEYRFETPEHEKHDYVFYPGPIVQFGETADYKYSAVRKWLKQAEDALQDARIINTGVDYSYLGATKEETWEQFPGNELTRQYLGNQKMTDRLFILSVDEAYRYRTWLWRFDGSEKRNPEEQMSEFCKGYWLRTPCGQAKGNQVYIVDLVRGNIRPEMVRINEGKRVRKHAGQEEIDVTGTTGVRPAFVLPQR